MKIKKRLDVLLVERLYADTRTKAQAIIMSGIGGDLCALIHEILPDAAIAAADLGDEYVTHGTVAELYRKHGLDGKSLADRFMEVRGS